jgi:hypothetical protein
MLKTKATGSAGGLFAAATISIMELKPGCHAHVRVGMLNHQPARAPCPPSMATSSDLRGHATHPPLRGPCPRPRGHAEPPNRPARHALVAVGMPRHRVSSTHQPARASVRFPRGKVRASLKPGASARRLINSGNSQQTSRAPCPQPALSPSKGSRGHAPLPCPWPRRRTFVAMPPTLSAIMPRIPRLSRTPAAVNSASEPRRSNR